MSSLSETHVNANPMQPKVLIDTLIFNNELSRDAYETTQRVHGFICSFKWLGSDFRGRDKYQVTREKI